MGGTVGGSLSGTISGPMDGSMGGAMGGSMGGAMSGGQDFITGSSINADWSRGTGGPRGNANIFPFMTLEGAEAMMDGLMGKRRRRR